MTTTRYAIELEPGVYYPGKCLFENASLHKIGTAEDIAEDCRSRYAYPQARIVAVKCEVVDD